MNQNNACIRLLSWSIQTRNQSRRTIYPTATSLLSASSWALIATVPICYSWRDPFVLPNQQRSRWAFSSTPSRWIVENTCSTKAWKMCRISYGSDNKLFSRTRAGEVLCLRDLIRSQLCRRRNVAAPVSMLVESSIANYSYHRHSPVCKTSMSVKAAPSNRRPSALLLSESLSSRMISRHLRV